MLNTKLIKKIVWDYNQKEIDKIKHLVEKINSLYEDWDSLSDEQIKFKTQEFKDRIKNWEKLDDVLPEAFATVKQACKRLKWEKFKVKWEETVWEMIPYDVQLIGGVVLHQWRIAEMKTWEWKTLVATLPLYLNALEGKWTHLVTVNDYLASRDADWMSFLFNWLELKVGSVTKEVPLEQRKEEYWKDITYVENSELWFDYLRDNLVKSEEERVLLRRDLNYAIVDEVDSIMIDEARTPLIISQPSAEPTQKYEYYSKLINILTPCKWKKKTPKWFLKELLYEDKWEEKKEDDGDYYIDEKLKTATLTSQGIKKLEDHLWVENLYKELWFQEIHHIENALKAKAVFNKDKDYLLRNWEVILVDENTWRAMPWRRYSEWLHQAIEAKEWVKIQKESQTLASITYQNFFNLYTKLAGMTWTASTEWEEFENIYWLDVVEIPTYEPIIRVDKWDKVYFNQRTKWSYVLDNIRFYHNIGVPFLIWTSSIETSEYLSSLLNKESIQHHVLNAKNHEQEANIVANAGNFGSVVVATNMAWRWTDIKLQKWLNHNLSLNYAKIVEKTLKWSEFQKQNPQNVELILYSQKELDITISGLKEVLWFSDEDFEKANKEEITTSNGKFVLRISYFSWKKTKDDPLLKINIKSVWEKINDTFLINVHYWLFILWTEKHESRRIDNQLRGRSWRQWDPGFSQFFVALDDEIMRKMWWERIQGIAKTLLPQDELNKMELTQKQFTNSIVRSQKQMEWWHFSVRKQLYDYDYVIDKQRKRIYEKRDAILKYENKNEESETQDKQRIQIIEEIKGFIPEVVSDFVNTYTLVSPWDIGELVESLNKISWDLFSQENLKWFSSVEKMKIYISKTMQEYFDKKLAEVEKEKMIEFLKKQYLNVIDKYWIDHIDDLQYLREKVSLYSFAQLDPLVIYKKEAYWKFNKLLFNIKQQIISDVLKIDLSFLESPQNYTNMVMDSQSESWDVMSLLKDATKDISTDLEKKSNKDMEIIEADSQETSKDFIPSQKKKIRPNDKCPCGSWKKYKKCCWKK